MKIQKPAQVKLIPELFKKAGYYTCLGTIGHATGTINPKHKSRLGKSDYNFEWDLSVFDAGEWSGRKKGQPFFAKICLSGGKARSQARSSKEILHVEASKVTLPPYYPRHPEVLEDWAAYLDTFSLMDKQVGQIVDRLKKEGEFENTVLFFITDHGVSHARGKQFCYDEGMMIPFFVHAPGRVKGGTVRKDPVLHIDLAATSLYFAGIEIPEYMEARPFFGPDAQARKFAVSARWTAATRPMTAFERSVLSASSISAMVIPSARICNPAPTRTTNRLTLRSATGERKASSMIFSNAFSLLPAGATEELYDLKTDPWELKNLADEPKHAKTLLKMRKTLDQWIKQTGDQGQKVESMKMYDSDMKIYMDGQASRGRQERADEIQANVDQMKKWWKEGK